MSPTVHASIRPASVLKIVLLSALASSIAAFVSLLLQRLVYHDWMHQTGPVRLVGPSIAAVLTFAFIYKWLLSQRERQAEMLRRFEIIAEMNDQIRNAVQAIACTNFAYRPDSTDEVRRAVEVIDQALRGVVDSVCTTPNVRPQAMHH